MAFKWFGDAFREKVRLRTLRNLADAGKAMVTDIRSEINIVGPPRSEPGNPPHIDSGDLFDSYKSVVDPVGLSVVAGSSLGYSLDLEYGTVKMAPRPHVRPAFEKNKAKYAKIMTRGK